jgi:hypothetical protein
VLFSSYASFNSIVNTLASYRIGSNTVDLEGMPSIAKANISPSFDQAKHQAYPSLGLSLSSPLLMLLIVHLINRNLMKP